MLVALGLVYYQLHGSAESASPREAFDMTAKDSTIVILDVRTPGEYSGESGHLPKALLIPVEDLERRIGELAGIKGKLIIAYCRSGRRSRNAAALLQGKGFRVLNMEGGILAWDKEGLPVVREGAR